MTKTVFMLALFGLGVSCAATTPGTLPAVITTVTPELIQSLVQTAGYTVKLDKTRDNPELTLTRKSGVTIYLNLHDCKTGSCSAMDAYTYYAADDLKTVPKDSDISTWNSENYSQAYIDAKDGNSVNLDSLYLFKGGFTKANLLNWLNAFKTDADNFDKMLQGL